MFPKNQQNILIYPNPQASVDNEVAVRVTLLVRNSQQPTARDGRASEMDGVFHDFCIMAVCLRRLVAQSVSSEYNADAGASQHITYGYHPVTHNTLVPMLRFLLVSFQIDSHSTPVNPTIKACQSTHSQRRNININIMCVLSRVCPTPVRRPQNTLA